jgi:hypothetical protein
MSVRSSPHVSVAGRADAARFRSGLHVGVHVDVLTGRAWVRGTISAIDEQWGKAKIDVQSDTYTNGEWIDLDSDRLAHLGEMTSAISVAAESGSERSKHDALSKHFRRQAFLWCVVAASFGAAGHCYQGTIGRYGWGGAWTATVIVMLLRVAPAMLSWMSVAMMMADVDGDGNLVRRLFCRATPSPAGCPNFH